MKKIRIKLLQLEVCNAELPYGKELQIVKLISRRQAAQFKSAEVTSFDKLLDQYGKVHQLREGEYYNGYAVVFYYWGKAQLVLMRGMLIETADEGHYWDCVIPTGKKSSKIPGGKVVEDGVFVSILSLGDCQFSTFANDLKQNGNLPAEVDTSAIGNSLKGKLQKAFVSEEHLMELDENENQVLRQYFGEYYVKFFTEVNY